MIKKLSSTHASLYEQYSRWKVKRKSCLIQSKLDTYGSWLLYMDYTISQSMGMKKVESTFLSPAQIPGQIWKDITQQHYDDSANYTTHG